MSRVTTERHGQVERRLEALRDRTLGLVAPLDDDDVTVQHDPIMSPLVWDLGHVANFEELWLLRALDGRPAYDAALDAVYNPFENPRWIRGELPVPGRPEALDYMASVRADALTLLRGVEFDHGEPLLRAGYVYAMVAQHEAQHQETMLQALDLRADLAPYEPFLGARRLVPRPADDTDRVLVPGGAFEMGTDDGASAYDNERPRHRASVATFAVDRFPVTCRRYAEFVDAGGYRRPELWSAGGRAWLEETGHSEPQGWVREAGGAWSVRRFGHVVPLDPAEPVQHVSFWEAEAFCRFAGGRLPTEAEWEKAALWDPAAGRSRRYPWGDTPPTADRANLDGAAWGPAAVGSLPGGASAYGAEQMLGDVHEWTSSDFLAYPGYETFPYEEYSEVFFDDGYKVLRGSSWASAALVARGTFRNWDHPQRRQIFSGIRVAYDVGA